MAQEQLGTESVGEIRETPPRGMDVVNAQENDTQPSRHDEYDQDQLGNITGEALEMMGGATDATDVQLNGTQPGEGIALDETVEIATENNVVDEATDVHPNGTQLREESALDGTVQTAAKSVEVAEVADAHENGTQLALEPLKAAEGEEAVAVHGHGRSVHGEGRESEER